MPGYVGLQLGRMHCQTWQDALPNWLPELAASLEGLLQCSLLFVNMTHP